jgi:3'(2'), 5'-bisphosphate nucleotidase
MLGLVDRKEPVFGVVYVPANGKLYYAKKGKGAFLEESGGKIRRLRVSKVDELKRSVFVMSRNHLSNKEREFVEKKKIKKSFYMGSIGVKLGLIAEGKAEGYINTSDKTFEWDICASDLILREAGGKVTDLRDEKFIYNRKNPRNVKGITASNGVIHSQVTAEIGDI